MRILIHDYAGHPFQVQLSRELARRGHAVTHAYAGGLLTPRGALAQRPTDPAGFEVVEVPMSPRYRADKYSFLKRRSYEVEYGRELVALVDRLKPEVVISGNTPTEPQWTFVRGARAHGIPFVSWIQDFYSVAVDKLARRKFPLVGPLIGRWYRGLDAKCLRASAGVVAITKDFLPILAEYGVSAETASVIPNWAPLDELPMVPKENDWARRHALTGKFVFLYAGTLAMKHNPELLCSLARRFAGDPNIRIVVISEGPGRDYLVARQAAEKLENLTLLPFQAFEEMPAVLASADVLLTVLEQDAGVFSVPSKVLTYLSAGRPILGAMPSANLASRILQEQEAGICVEPDDVDGFIGAAVRLAADAPERTRMAKRARAYAEREFDIQRVASQFEEVFARALKSSPKG